ncbi:chromosome segregation protein SMC [Anaerovorax sp. IOR16]|uniref:chromosome segregation protein SMC n=1 Tax=Anaerovorax sp. IOR16 TaxID=2773458 RepID=UPI0019D12942|nr:chromosome segregation protein SMC [Anaerovorax sp. IOR16]
MYFKRIDLHGFKSFADPVSIEFHEGITCIVGPNGSGKSNISDAIRWVLGEQSPKMLRGGKMEEVIFAGTANRKSRGMAEATLVIDNSTGVLPIDYAEIAITRRMYRSGESAYSINNNPCRLRDIRELIMDTGIGVDGYSLIGQGKISEIVSNKPESRREIFEEAAGIVKYRSKKAEAERKLESSQNNLDRVNDIVGEIESRIGGLKEDSEKASEYLVLRDKYKEVEINITLKNIESIELKNEYLKDDLTELNSQIEENKEQKKVIETDLTENRTRNEQLDSQGLETRDLLLKKIEEINSLVNQSQLSEEKLSVMEKDAERLKEEIDALDMKAEKEKNNWKGFDEKHKELTEEWLQQKETLHRKTQSFETLSSEILAYQSSVEARKNRIYELHSIMSSKKAESNSLLSLLGTLQSRKEQLNIEKEASLATNRGMKQAFEKVQEENNSATARMKQLKEEMRETKHQYEQDLEQEKSVRKQMEDLRISIGQTATRQKMMEEMEQSYDGYNHGVRFVMRSKELSGIHGVIAELIKVPLGFETAIETALGAAMQNIVCEDDKSAQAAVSALKKNRAGRLTFLPLSSISTGKVVRDDRLMGELGFKGFAVDCIEFDPKYKVIMEYLLGRVIIVDELNHAVALSKSVSRGFRFVTLEGEVINASGAITGGTHRNNTANLLERKAEITKLKDALFKMEQNRLQGDALLSELHERIKKLKKNLEEQETAYRETEMVCMRSENELKHVSLQICEVENNENRWQKELEHISKEEKSAQSMIEELSETVQTAEQEKETLERLVEEQMEDLKNKQQVLQESQEEITKLRLQVGSLQNECNSFIQMNQRIEEYLDDLMQERRAKEENIRTIEEQKMLLLQGGTDLKSAVSEKEEEKYKLEELLKKIQEEKSLLVRYLAEVEKKKESIEDLLLHGQTAKHDLELKLTKNETQVDSFKNKLWEDFEISYIQAMEFSKKEFVMNAALKESREIKSRMKALGEVNIGSIKEYESVKERYEFLTEQRSDLLEAMNALKQIIMDMDKTIRSNFKESFDKIVVNFEKAFQELFGGGTAELRLEDETKPLECGIEIVAQPPGKKLQNINLMSGGEKTMTAIALMFAVLKAKPTPFCILDEVEAALDEANIDRFANYLRNFHEIQFALVTHQKATMEFADVLYGVTMPEQGVSKVISLRLGDRFEL